MRYIDAGVDYTSLDAFKREAQAAALETAGNISRLGISLLGATRGESAQLVEMPDLFLAHVDEGLGTKNLVADEMCRLTGKSYYDGIAQDTVAMVVNDIITSGASPISMAMHLAVGDSGWFQDQVRYRNLIAGWKNACGLARCAWGGGETSTLKGLLMPHAAVLSGSAVGLIEPKERQITGDIQHGDAIVLLESSGIHANGLTMARAIADTLPHGYLTKLSDGRTYGDALLDPTEIYVPVVEDCLNFGIKIHYAVNVTGHGWRKLMRAPGSLAYIIENVPKPQPVFDFIQKHGPVDDAEAYGNLNMGAGFALYVSPADAKNVLRCLAGLRRFVPMIAGHVEKSNEKKVVIKPKELEYCAATLGVR